MGLKQYAALGGFVFCTLCLYISMIIGSPSSLFSPDVWRAWIDSYKGGFGTLIVAYSWWTSPAKMRIYSSSEELKFKVRNGRLQSQFGSRAVVIANHQIYSDWMYLWYVAYTSKSQGSIIIASKKSLRKLPLLGSAMGNFRFLFLSRKWEDDKTQIVETMDYSSKDKTWPVWMCLFPEGTVYNKDTWKKTEDYGAKTGVRPESSPKHLSLPRVKGLYTILNSLNASIPILYDMTVVYEPVADTEVISAESKFSLKKTFFKGRGPKTIKLHVREFSMQEIPYKESEEVFQQWLYQRWAEKDQIYENLVSGNLETEFKSESDIRPGSMFELYQCFNVLSTLAMLTHLVLKWAV